MMNRIDPDLALVERARRGEPEAFGEIANHYQGRIYRLALCILREGARRPGDLSGSLVAAPYPGSSPKLAPDPIQGQVL